MRKTGVLLRMMRPLNCVLMGFAVIAGASLAEKNVFSSIASVKLLPLGFVTAFTLTGAAMIINDVYDRTIDAVNEPDRPIPSGLVTPKEALAFASSLSIIGLVSAVLANFSCFALALAALSMLLLYNTRGKSTGLPGNMLVSACVVVPFVYGSILAVNSVRSYILIFSILVFLSNTGREITKGIADNPGDALNNVKTIAVAHGSRVAAVSSAAFIASAVALSPLPLLFNLVSYIFIPIVIVADIGFISSAASLVRDFSIENARKTKNLILIWFFFGLVAFFVGSF